MTLESLEAGQVLPEATFVIQANVSAAYRGVVADGSPLYRTGHVVPGMAVAALALGKVMDAVQLPGGAVHTGQELEFMALVKEGSYLGVQATVAQNSVRMGARFVVLEFTVVDSSVAGAAQPVMRGRSTVTIPAGVVTAGQAR